jgi:predicted CoA-substrate-specific enzyme activase
MDESDPACDGHRRERRRREFPMTTYAMGIDFGSTTGKVVILDDAGRMVASAISHRGAVSDEGVAAAQAEALAQAGIDERAIARAVSTGYGRRMLDIADRTVTEITCHARGAVALVPEVRLVIDIGGQDSKVIAIDPNGLVARFAMNDRCAAGTGKFLEVLARALGVELDRMGPVALEASESVNITSMCATFAETEVISLLAEGRPKPVILAGVHRSIATRTVGLVARVGKREPVVMTGGVSRNVAAVRFLEQALGTSLIVPKGAQLAGAVGAALFALDDLRAGAEPKAASRARAADEQDPPQVPSDDSPACRRRSAGSPEHPRIPAIPCGGGRSCEPVD